MLTIKALVWIAVLMVAAPAWAQNTEDGVDLDSDVAGMAFELESARTNGMNFDPPCSFSSTLPLMAAPYLDPATQSHFLDGEGAVLNKCANFGVSGFSDPNFLAWNCNALNLDGTRPVLPLEIKFLRPMSRVSINVASGNNAGSTATLRVFNAAHSQIGAVSTTLTAAVKTLTLTVGGIRYATLSGPCVMIADDLAYNP